MFKSYTFPLPFSYSTHAFQVHLLKSHFVLRLFLMALNPHFISFFFVLLYTITEIFVSDSLCCFISICLLFMYLVFQTNFVKDQCLTLFLGFLTAVDTDITLWVCRMKKGPMAYLGSGRCGGKRMDSSLLMAVWH